MGSQERRLKRTRIWTAENCRGRQEEEEEGSKQEGPEKATGEIRIRWKRQARIVAKRRRLTIEKKTGSFSCRPEVVRRACRSRRGVQRRRSTTCEVDVRVLQTKVSVEVRSVCVQCFFRFRLGSGPSHDHRLCEPACVISPGPSVQPPISAVQKVPAPAKMFHKTEQRGKARWAQWSRGQTRRHRGGKERPSVWGPAQQVQLLLGTGRGGALLHAAYFKRAEVAR